MYFCFAESGNDTKRKKQPAGMANYGTSMYNNQGANKTKQGKSSGYGSASTPKESTPRGVKEVSEIHI
jgi:transcription initiation factor TFIID subunit 1